MHKVGDATGARSRMAVCHLPFACRCLRANRHVDLSQQVEPCLSVGAKGKRQTSSATALVYRCNAYVQVPRDCVGAYPVLVAVRRLRIETRLPCCRLGPPPRTLSPRVAKLQHVCPTETATLPARTQIAAAQHLRDRTDMHAENLACLRERHVLVLRPHVRTLPAKAGGEPSPRQLPGTALHPAPDKAVGERQGAHS